MSVSATGPLSAAEAMVRIRMAMQSNDLAGARAVAEKARRDHPSDAALADAAGSLALKANDAVAAEAHFARACELAPTMLDYALNHAIALQRFERHTDVIALLERHEKQGHNVARYGSVRALSHRSLGEPTDAAHWYDVVLSLEPRHPRGLHGRARVAMERGEMDALQRFDTALSVNPGDADLWLGKAQALDVSGDVAGARVVAEQICAQAPSFIAALTFLAGLKLAAGEADFTAPFREAAEKAPQDPNIASAHAEVFAGIDRAAEAAEIAAQARKRFPNEPHFAFLEAVHAGAAGEWERAETIFRNLRTDTPMRALHEARHRIRSGELAKAETLLETALNSNAWDISAWALRGIVWRLVDDKRSEWLHEQAGLVQFRPLSARADLINDVIGELRALHDASAMPLGQSLRGGTQTRGILFHRTEPLLAELHLAILTTIEEYRADLPTMDQTHPLLRHREKPWQLAGSWSVRLTGGDGQDGGAGGDYHTSHIHPQGIISSALYLVVPEDAHGEDQHGWLEIGRPPPDLGLDLPPLRAIQPSPGHIALFPSTFYHGTTAFGGTNPKEAERMTVAFDVVPSEVGPV